MTRALLQKCELTQHKAPTKSLRPLQVCACRTRGRTVCEHLSFLLKFQVTFCHARVHACKWILTFDDASLGATVLSKTVVVYANFVQSRYAWIRAHVHTDYNEGACTVWIVFNASRCCELRCHLGARSLRCPAWKMTTWLVMSLARAAACRACMHRGNTQATQADLDGLRPVVSRAAYLFTRA